MKPLKKFKIIAKTLFGLEDILANEIQNLGGEEITKLKRAVSFTGDQYLLYKANYLLRTAISILKPIANFEVRNEDDLYRYISKINWNHYMEINTTFLINAIVNSNNFKHSKYVAYKTKDAIVDQFRRKTGQRPSIDTETPDIKINVHITNNNCTVSLDSSGEPLFKRGYRLSGHKAPLNEVLAAGMIILANWDGTKNFIDPLCGSGTLLIEAAMIAANIPPGNFRTDFGFMNWKDYDELLFTKVKSEAKPKQSISCKIIGSDISKIAFDIANKNLQNAGVRKFVELKLKDIENVIPPPEGGILITNPPFGERIKKEDLNSFYSTVGTRLKHHFAGYEAWILSSNFEALKFIGLHPTKKHILFNGALECKYQQFKIYEGSRKKTDSMYK
ncbi:MAG: class I SAM-dependent RNA methyltransferase [Chlorobi bacterium]|nr:class I SAM-dependent RNA methyltransferase [Chlorobiota bacterium]